MAISFSNMTYYSLRRSPSPSPSRLTLAAAGRFRAAKASLAKNDQLPVERKLGAEKKKGLCFRPARQVQEQVTHSMEPAKMAEMFKTLEEWAEKELLGFLKPVEKSWQPQDLLPDPSSEEFFEQVKELRQRAEEIPDEYFVCLVGNMITEEALPTYQTFLNTLDGVGDETCASLSSWSIWTRAWTAEENRHGDLLKQYLYLSGRVHMKQVEKTIQYLIGSGMYVKTENSPYRGYVYTSFQERATFITHGNTARQAKQHGDLKLAQILGTIAADEKRHEAAYVRIVEKLFEVDPDGAVIAFADMMKRKIVMPGHLMYDGRDQALFDHLGAVTHRLGVYTAADYADILDFLVGRWKVQNLADGCLSDQGKMARDYVCGLAPRVRRLHQIARERRATRSPSSPHHLPFSWIFDRELPL